MPVIRVAGVDPALNNLGMVKGNLDLSTLKFTPTEVSLVSTKPDNSKGVYKNEDDLRRARELSTALIEFTEGVDMIFIEMPVGSQSARAMASYGISVGVCAALDEGQVILTSAKQGKFYLTGSYTASKASMIKHATEKYPNLGWLTNARKGISASNEHIADAIGSVLAGINTHKFKSTLLTLRTIWNL